MNSIFLSRQFPIAVLAFALATSLLILTALPALANGGRHNRGGSDVDVQNNNSANVLNVVLVGADTGDNSADGGDGGNGSKAGDGGDGGIVTTGNATAGATVKNRINSNKTNVDLCGCRGDNKGDVDVRNRNSAHVKNIVLVGADTGDNSADGGDGGDSRSRGGHRGHRGGGGDGGAGGDVWTGDADANARVVNVVNRNMTRIRR